MEEEQDLENIKSYLIDFAEGRVTVPEFIEYCKTHSEVLDYLTKIADSEFKTYVTHISIDENGYKQYTVEELPFDASLDLQSQLSRGGGNLARYLNIHSFYSKIITTAFPTDNITVDTTLDEKSSFMSDACPEYIGGPEVEELLGILLETLPKDLSKSKKIRLYKEKLKELFHIEQNKYPRWVQEAEWPMGSDNLPMRFVGQKRKKGKAYETMLYTEFLFEDVKTGEQRIIEQFT